MNKEYIASGFKAFDDKAQGFQRGNLYTITGDSGTGKSTLALTIAVNLAKQEGLLVEFACNTASHEQMITSMASNILGLERNLWNKRNYDSWLASAPSSELNSFSAQARPTLRYVGSQDTEKFLAALEDSHRDVIIIDDFNVFCSENVESIAMRLQDIAKKRNSVVIVTHPPKGRRGYLCLAERSNAVLNIQTPSDDESTRWIQVVKARSFEPFDFPLTQEFNFCRFTDYVDTPADDPSLPENDPIAVVESINAALWEKAEGGRKKEETYHIAQVTYHTNGDSQWIMFLGQTLWSSEEDSRPWDETGNHRIVSVRYHVIAGIIQFLAQASNLMEEALRPRKD